MNLLRPLRHALSLLTRLPVAPPAHASATQGYDRDLGRALWFFPWVGLLLGGILLGMAWGLQNVPPGLMAWFTGGLHLDGVADMADGLGGSRGAPQRALTIMKDSRVGALGVVALVITLGLKQQILSLLLQQQAWVALTLGPWAARLAVVALVVGYPPAQSSGLAHGLHQVSRKRDVVWAGLLGVALAVAMFWHPLQTFWPELGWRLSIALGVAIMMALMVGLWAWRRLGGVNGDVYGAAVEWAEISFWGAFYFSGKSDI